VHRAVNRMEYQRLEVWYQKGRFRDDIASVWLWPIAACSKSHAIFRIVLNSPARRRLALRCARGGALLTATQAPAAGWIARSWRKAMPSKAYRTMNRRQPGKVFKPRHPAVASKPPAPRSH
jgi:hypothetical protein